MYFRTLLSECGGRGGPIRREGSSRDGATLLIPADPNRRVRRLRARRQRRQVMANATIKGSFTVRESEHFF